MCFLCVWEAGWGPNPPVISSRALDDGGGCVRQSHVIIWALASPPSLPLAVTRLVLRRSVWQIRWILSCRACMWDPVHSGAVSPHRARLIGGPGSFNRFWTKASVWITWAGRWERGSQRDETRGPETKSSGRPITDHKSPPCSDPHTHPCVKSGFIRLRDEGRGTRSASGVQDWSVGLNSCH